MGREGERGGGKAPIYIYILYIDSIRSHSRSVFSFFIIYIDYISRIHRVVTAALN